jgi:hypothetical protein
MTPAAPYHEISFNQAVSEFALAYYRDGERQNIAPISTFLLELEGGRVVDLDTETGCAAVVDTCTGLRGAEHDLTRGSLQLTAQGLILFKPRLHS